jgi:hypothetical protein
MDHQEAERETDIAANSEAQVQVVEMDHQEAQVVQRNIWCK